MSTHPATIIQNTFHNIIAAWNLGARITPDVALTYAIATALMGVSAVMWGFGNPYFSALYIAGIIILAQAIARDSLEHHPIGRMLVLLSIGIIAQLAFSLSLSPLINPLFTYGIGMGITWAIRQKYLIIKIGIPVLAFGAALFSTPIIYGIWLIPAYQALYQLKHQHLRTASLALLTLILIPISPDNHAWLGLVVAALIPILNQQLRQISAQQKIKLTFATTISHIALVYFAFALFKNF
jgi:hypothetical protein